LNLRTGWAQCYACNESWSPQEFAALAGLPELVADGGREPATEYVYRTPDGSRHSRVTRFPGKKFRQARWTGTDWEWKAPKTRIPFRADRLIAADPADLVLWVEGEKDVETAEALGFLATTSPGGASAAGKLDRAILAQVAAGRRFVVVPDNDEPGRQYAATVAGLLTQAGAAEVRLLDLAKVWPSGPAPKGGDLSDWIAAGGRSEDLRRMAQEAPQAAPEPSDDLQDPPAPGSAGRRPRGAVRPVLVRLAGVRPERPRYLWQGRVVLGGLSVIGGRPGLGKSLTLIALAAAVTTGRPVLPDEDPCPRGSVLLLTAEDTHEEIARRLLAASADMDRVACLTLVETADGQKRGLSLRDVAAIEEAVDELGDVVLIGIDPITAFWDGSDSHKDTEVRGLLSALVEMAGRRNIALVAVAHHRKSQAGFADYQIGGSIALVAAARSVLHVFPDKSDRRRRILAPGKNNLGPPAPSWSFAICDRGDGPAVEWVEAVEADANDLLAEPAVLGPPAPKRQSAEAWLRTRLAGGPVAAAKLKEEGQDAGFHPRTLDRARVEIGATATKAGMGGGWFWALPGQNGEMAPSGENGDESPWLQKATRRRQVVAFEGDNEGCRLPQVRKATPISVREDPPDDLLCPPVDLDSDPLQDLQVAGELLL
jgi:hypothetical protein